MAQEFELQQASKQHYRNGLIVLAMMMVIVLLTLALSWPVKSESRLNDHSNTPTVPAVGTEAKAIASDIAPEMSQLWLLKPLTGRLTHRPDFVSVVEWQVLQGVAGQQADSDQQLTRLVNNLRFNKQLAAWRSLLATKATSQRQQLARLILADIPAHVALQELTLDEAKNLQQQLLADIVPDSQQRHQRLEQEGKRLHSVLIEASP